MIYAFDIETYLITNRNKAPKPVCCTYHTEGNQGICTPDDPLIIHLLSQPDMVLVGQNISYDVLCMMRWFPHTIPHFIRLYNEGRVFDTMTREALLHLQEHGREGYRPYRSLQWLVEKYLGLDISGDKKGDDIWRLKYGTLDGVPIAQWPTNAVGYALKDAEYTYKVFMRQGQLNNSPPTETLQVRADLVLHAIGAWGFMVDRDKNNELHHKVSEKIKILNDEVYKFGWTGTGSEKNLTEQVRRMFAYKQLLIFNREISAYEGTIDYDYWERNLSTVDLKKYLQSCIDSGECAFWSGSVAAIQHLLLRIPEMPLTGKKMTVSTSEETLKLLYDVCPQFESLVKLKHEQKMLSTYIEPFAVDVSHGRYTNLNSTGRTSCTPPHQTIPRGGGLRSQFRPRPQYVFGTVDYSMLELCTLAATYSVMWPNSPCALADVINNGADVHSFTASLISGIPYADFIKGKDENGVDKARKDSPYKEYRQSAKACNFGFPGGLWINAFVKYAESNYDVKISYEEAVDIRKAWVAAFPEIDTVYIREHKSKCRTKGSRMTSVLINGRQKAACTFTEACNFRFQGLAADGAKAALWGIWSEIALSFYHKYYLGDASSPLADSRLAAFVHDEIVAEHPENEQGEAAFARQKDIMVDQMMQMCQNKVSIRVEGKIDRLWDH